MSLETRDIQIRQAAPEDAAAVCHVLRRSITEGCVQDHRHDPATLKAWLGNKTPETVSGWFASPTNFSLVAERAGVLVGVALLTQAGKLALCYVLPEAQGQGVGRRLLEGIEAQARAWNIGKIRLHSTLTASAFFARRGYLLAGREKSCFGLDSDFRWKQLDACDSQQSGSQPGTQSITRKRFCNCGSA
jgi:N-acetylglutamate synthase-like GNAT family acetyltransferase